MAYRDSTTASGNSDTPSVAVPAGVAIGDIVILACAIDVTAAVFDTGDWPSGFTELSETDITADGHSAAVGWKRLTAADSGSYTFGALGAAGDWVCQAFAFSGRHASNPPIASAVNVQNTPQTSPITVTANGVTAVAGDDLLWISAPDVTATDIGNGHTAPASYTEREDAELAWSNLSGATQENVGAGATGNISGTFALTADTAGWAAWLVRIPLADAGPPGGFRLLENGTDRRLLEDGVSFRILEETQTGVSLESRVLLRSSVISAANVGRAIATRTVGRSQTRTAANVLRLIAARTAGGTQSRSAVAILRDVSARASSLSRMIGEFSIQAGAITLDAIAHGGARVRAGIQQALSLTVRSSGSAKTQAPTNVARAVTARISGASQSRSSSVIARTLGAKVNASAITRAATNVARSLTVRTAGTVSTAANTAVARLLAVRATGQSMASVAFEGLGAITARIVSGARVIGSLISIRALETRTSGGSATRSAANVVRAFSAAISGRTATRANSAIDRGLAAGLRAGGSALAGIRASRALSAVIRAGASARLAFPPLFVEVVGIVGGLLRASMSIVGIKSSMSAAVIRATVKTANLIVVSATNMIAKKVTLKDYVIGDDTRISFQLTEWPVGALLTKAYLTIKKKLSDPDTAAIIQRDITSSLTAEGQITLNGSTGTAEGYFQIRHQDTEWVNVKALVDYNFDIQPITDQGTVLTPIVGIISFIKGATDATL